MSIVEIREDTTYTPICTVCKIPVIESTTVQREATVAADRHELEHHSEPEEEDF